MRLISFLHEGTPRFGALVGDLVADFTPLAPAGVVDLKSAIAAGILADLAAKAVPSLPLASVTLLPVIPNPGKILCVGHNYETHRQETGRAKVANPSIFTRFADTLVAAGQPIQRPRHSTHLDFEGELAVVIGKGGRDIPAEQALDHVAGYACFNDASVRDWQWHTQQFTPGKNFPATGGFGPTLVTPDEVGDYRDTSVTTRLNGQVVQSQSTAEMIFPIATIIAYISAFTPLSPGDVIATGTPGGVGAKREPPLWMKPGDVVEVDIPGIGLLRNTIADAA
jgi:2-keto-4-pentenoate hydratase/2-oxohepta-3-ene-1,7-dioic acid hydratase in catechol pathway